MRITAICVLVLVFSVVGCIPGVVGIAEETTDAQVDTTPPNDIEADNEERSDWKSSKENADAAGNPSEVAVASEVADMMRDPYHLPVAVDSDDEKGTTVDSDTVAVNDSHVIKENKTHESEVMLTNPEQQTPIPVPLSSSSSSPSPSSSPVLPVIPEISQEQANATASNVDTVSTSVGTEGSPTLTTSPEGVTEKNNPLISTGLSSISIVAVSRSAMSPPTEVAAILAIVLVVSALVGYVGMLGWRRFLEKRYGNREMLVNEDDDLRHFEL